MYIRIHTYMCVCVCIYIYIYSECSTHSSNNSRQSQLLVLYEMYFTSLKKAVTVSYRLLSLALNLHFYFNYFQFLRCNVYTNARQN